MGPRFHAPRLLPWRRLGQVALRGAALGAVLFLGVSGGAVARAQSGMSTALFNTAAEYQNNGEHAKAAEKWREFLQKFPEDGRRDRARFHLGTCLLHNGERPAAVAEFEKVLAESPNFSQADAARYNLGMAWYETAVESQKPEDFRRAAQALQETADKHKESKYAAQALYYQGESLYAAGDGASAVTVYDRAAREYPQSELLPQVMYAQGVTQQELGEDSAAAATFDRFLKNDTLAKHELAGEIRLRLGMSHFNQGKFNEAEKLFGETAKLGAGLADYALLQQANCRLELDRAKDALPLLAELLQRFPESPYASAARLLGGRTHFEAGEFDPAATMLAPLATADAPEAAEAAYWLTRARLAQQKPAEALAVAEPASQKFKEGEFAPYLAVARLDAIYELPERRAETAMQYAAFARANGEHPLAPQALYMAALVALETGKHAESKQFAEEFLKNAKWNEAEVRPAVLFIAGEANLLASPHDAAAQAAAETHYRELVGKHASHPRAGRAHLRIGWCLLEQQKPADAVNYLNGIVGGLADAELRAEGQLTLGRARAAQGQHREATAAFEAGRQAKGDWSRGDELLLAAAESYCELGEVKTAGERIAQFFASYPESPYRDRGLFLAGDVARREGKFQEAAARFGELREKFPESELAASAAYAQASALYAEDDFKAALPPLDALLAVGGDEELVRQAKLLRGLTYRGLEQHDRAVTDLQAYLASDPPAETAADARLVLGLSLAAQGKHTEAIAALTELVNESPDYAKADQVWYEIGQAELLNKNGTGAFAAFRTLGEKHPQSPHAAEAAFHVASHFENQAEAAEEEAAKKAAWKEAATALSTGLSRNPSEGLKEKLRYKLGEMQFRGEEFEAAAQTLTTQVNELPQGELAHHGRFLAAESYFRLDKFDQALPLYEQLASTAVEPYTARALYRAASCAQSKKDWSRAEKHFAELLAKFPNDEQKHQARFGLGVAFQMQNKLNEARAALTQVAAETDAEVAAKALYGLGEIAFAQQQHDEAIDKFLSVAVGYPYPQWQAMARFEAGRCYLEKKDTENAAKQFQTVVERFPDHPAAQDCRRLLADLKGN